MWIWILIGLLITFAGVALFLLRRKLKTKSTVLVDHETAVAEVDIEIPPQAIPKAERPKELKTFTKQRQHSNKKSTSDMQRNVKPPFPNKTENSIQLFQRKLAFIIKKPADVSACYKCSSELEEETISLGTSPSIHLSGKQMTYFSANVLTCRDCKYVCAEDKLIRHFKQKMNGRYIDVRNWGHTVENQSKNIKQKSLVSSSTDFKWPSTYAVETIKSIPTIVDGFAKESRLHRLGYRISSTSRQKRWRILEQEALPQLGLKEIAYTIAGNVRARKRQRGGSDKYKYAIAEWEHDLSELKRNYYKRDFTWPRTD